MKWDWPSCSRGRFSQCPRRASRGKEGQAPPWGVTSKHHGCRGLQAATKQAPDCVSAVAALWERSVGGCRWPGLRSECGTHHPAASVCACGCPTHTLSWVSRPSHPARGGPERPRSLLPGALSHPSGADPQRGKWGLRQAGTWNPACSPPQQSPAPTRHPAPWLGGEVPEQEGSCKITSHSCIVLPVTLSGFWQVMATAELGPLWGHLTAFSRDKTS